MTATWEYTLVAWSESTSDQSSGDPTWKSQFTIYRPGQESEVRPSSDSSNPEAKKTWLTEVLNDLGAEGWELVSETTLSTTIVGTSLGWKESGVPIEMRWLLKRPL